jgi:hypothetical protein
MTDNETKEMASALGCVVGATFLALAIFKLSGETDLPWAWVTAPLWGTLAFFGLLLFVIVMVMLAVDVYARGKSARARKKRGWV